MCVILEAPRDYVTMTVHLLICCCTRRNMARCPADDEEDSFCSSLHHKKKKTLCRRPSFGILKNLWNGGRGGTEGTILYVGQFMSPFVLGLSARALKRTHLNRRARQRIDKNIFIVPCPAVRTGFFFLPRRLKVCRLA